MEILIPGLILVALMVWASTKIKKKAAAAYEEETIETERFSIEKADGFISPTFPEEGMVFAAYSKEFGRDRTRDLRQAQLEVSLRRGARLEQLARQFEIDSSNGVVEVPAPSGDLAEFVRLAASSEGVYELRGRVLLDHRQEFARKLKEMMASFNPK
ncbi:MAG TPA: hypothetical protein VK918_01190 [Pyrinomonadaceae bacterium]|nr:hypothetical protein [Pyrinomonadaceae bacterium]